MCISDINTISIISPISNIVCLSLCEISLISGFLVFLSGGKILLLNRILLYIADISCNLIIKFCDAISKISITNVPTGYDCLKYSTIATIIVCVICYGIFKNRKFLLKILSLGIVSTLIITCAVKSYDDNKLKIAILGKSTYKVMVISYKNDVHIIDFSKNYKTAKYVEKYCKQFGLYKINSISFLKKGYQTMSMYNTLLKNVSVTHINVPLNTYFRKNQTILSKTPNYIDTLNKRYLYNYDTFSITVYNDNSFDITINDSTQTFTTDEYNIIFESNLNGFFYVRDLRL